MERALERAETACRQCGLPVAARRGEPAAPWCCLGCEIAAAVGGAGSGGEPGRILARVGLAAFLSMNVMMLSFALYGATPQDGEAHGWISLLRWAALALSAPALALLLPPLARAGFSRAGGTRIRVEGLVVAASLAAFAISAANTIRERGDVFLEAATMVPLVVTVGSWLAARARTKAREELRALFGETGASFRVDRGGVRRTLPEAGIAAGDRVELPAGARAPADGVALEALSAASDSSLLTGEPGCRPLSAGDPIRAGEVVRRGFVLLRADAAGADSTLGRLRAALERALADPPASARAVDRAAQALVAVTGGLALGLVAFFGARGAVETGVVRALALLTVACPCALGLAAPLVLTRALGAAARLGAAVQSLDGFERLGRIERIAADKTGTLTLGEPDSLRVELAGGEEREETLALLAALGRGSRHPIAQAVRDATAGVEPAPLAEAVEEAGVGIRAIDALGRELRLERARAGAGENARAELVREGRLLATIVARESARPGAERLGSRLAALGIDLVILSGDAQNRVDALAAAMGARGLGGLAPDAKAREVDRMRASGGPVALLADGANDSIALARADVSIVVDRRLEWLADGADLVLMGDRVAALPELVALARRARRRVIGALAWAAAYHAVTLTLGALGMLGPAQAALWMALGSVAVVHAGTRPLATPPALPDPLAPPEPASAPRAAPQRNVASAAGAFAP